MIADDSIIVTLCAKGVRPRLQHHDQCIFQCQVERPKAASQQRLQQGGTSTRGDVSSTCASSKFSSLWECFRTKVAMCLPFRFPRPVLCSVAIIVCCLHFYKRDTKDQSLTFSDTPKNLPHILSFWPLRPGQSNWYGGGEAMTVLFLWKVINVSGSSSHAMRDYFLTFPLPLLPQSPYTLLIINIIRILETNTF